MDDMPQAHAGGVIHAYRYLRCQLSALNPLPDFEEMRQLVKDLAFSSYMAAPGRAFALKRTAGTYCSARGVIARSTAKTPAEPTIFVCDSRALIDAALICSAIPCAPIATAADPDSALVSMIGARMSATLTADTGAQTGAQVLRVAKDYLKQGVNLLAFVGDDGCGRGLAGLARMVGAPIVPVKLTGEGSRSWKLAASWGKPQHITVHIGETLRIGEAESATLFAERVTRVLRAFSPSVETKAPHRAWSGAESWGQLPTVLSTQQAVHSLEQAPNAAASSAWTHADGQSVAVSA